MIEPPKIWVWLIEGSLEVKLPTIYGQKREDQRRERGRRKKMQVRQMVGKSRNTVFYPMICGSGGSKSRLAKAAGAEPSGQMREEKLHPVVARSTFASEKAEVELSKKCTPLWREAHLEVKMYEAYHARITFRSWDVKSVHAVVARSTCPSQNVQNAAFSDHFWKLTCRISARGCGAKHISKSKVLKTDGLGTFLDVQMSLRVAGARDSVHCQKWAKREDL